MAKIIKVGSNNPTITPNKIANPFKTSRNSTTNPFKFSNFEGNALPFADVFEGFEPKSTSKLKLIASSVTGSMNKMRSSIAEPIVNFVNRVRENITSAWDYAKNTNISDLAAVKAFNEVMNKEIALPSVNLSGISESMSNLANKISERTEFLNRDVLDISKEMAGKWSDMIAKIQLNGHIVPKNASVAEIEELWRNEIALAGGAI